MKVTAKLEGIDRVNFEIARLMKLVGDAAKDIPLDEARLFAASVMRALPPTASKAAQSARSGGTKEQEQRGKAAVARSHRNAMPWFESKADEQESWLDRAIKAGNIEQANRAAQSTGLAAAGLRFGAFSADGIKRARFNGRVYRKRNKNVLIRQTDLSARDSHTEAKQRNVGMMKGAWSTVVADLNHRTGSRSAIPSWVKSNATRGKSWLGTHHMVGINRDRSTVSIASGVHPWTAPFIDIAMRSRANSVRRKIRAIQAGQASFVGGKYKIHTRDEE